MRTTGIAPDSMAPVVAFVRARQPLRTAAGLVIVGVYAYVFAETPLPTAEGDSRLFAQPTLFLSAPLWLAPVFAWADRSGFSQWEFSARRRLRVYRTVWLCLLGGLAFAVVLPGASRGAGVDDPLLVSAENILLVTGTTLVCTALLSREWVWAPALLYGAVGLVMADSPLLLVNRAPSPVDLGCGIAALIAGLVAAHTRAATRPARP